MTSYRTYETGDAPAIVALIAEAMPSDPVSLEWFGEYVLLDANFDPEGLIVAVDDHRIRGVVYAVRHRGGAGIPVDPDGGWITIGAVDPDFRKRGIGGELTRRAIEFLRSRGSRWVTYSGYPPAYFLPGLDADTYPDGLRLLERHGFRTVSRPVAMHRDISTHAPPDTVRELHRLRAKDEYRFEPAAIDDLPDVMAFASDRIAPDWGEVIRAAAVRFGRADRVMVARDPGGAVVGFAMYGAYRGPAERFGPFGVDQSQRGAGLGTIILHLTLQRMRAEGLHSAWFLWTGADSPAGRLYSRAGFTVTRTFHVMRFDLQPLTEAV